MRPTAHPSNNCGETGATEMMRRQGETIHQSSGGKKREQRKGQGQVVIKD